MGKKPCMAWLVLGAALALAPRSAHADDAREASRAEFRRGVTLVNEGDFQHAREAFAEAYRLFPHPSILFNLGLTRAKTGEYVQAEQDLVRFLADDGGATQDEVQSARQALATTRTHLGTFKLRVEPAGARARLDDDWVALVAGDSVSVRTSTGAHSLHVEAEGHVARDLDVDVDSSRVDTVDVRLVPVHVPDPNQGKTQRTAGYALIGTGSVIAAFGIFAGVYAIVSANAYNTAGDPNFQNPDTKSTGTTFRTLADVSFITALVTAGVGAALVLAAPRATTTVAAGPTGVWLTQKF